MIDGGIEMKKTKRGIPCVLLLGLVQNGLSWAGESVYETTWESLQQYECPDWFRDAKFGLYAHWGPYCVPAFPTTTDWYSHHMYQPDHAIHKYHVETYGPVTKFGYKEFVPLFTAPRFDADKWAQLYKECSSDLWTKVPNGTS